MKKTYESPRAEVVKFEYKDQVVVASGCSTIGGNTGFGRCDKDPYGNPLK